MKLYLFIILLFFSLLYASEWTSFEIGLEQNVWASSYLSENFMNKRLDYSPENIFDNQKGTCWIEGSGGSGAGESVSFIVNEIPVKLFIINGFARSKNTFSKNNRVKKIRLIPSIGISPPGYVNSLGKYQYFIYESEMPLEFDLKDKYSEQQIPLKLDSQDIANLKLTAIDAFSRDYPDQYSLMLENSGLDYNLTENDLEELIMIYGILYLKIEILEIYKGSKYDSACISEIRLVY